MCLPQKPQLPGTGLKQMKLRFGLAEAGTYAMTRPAGNALRA